MKLLSSVVLFICIYSSAFAQNETLSVSVTGDTVTIFNYGAQENCAARFAIDLQILGNLITMTEQDTVKAKANCNCTFDLSAASTGFSIGKYGVMVYRNYLKKFGYQSDTLVFIGSTSFIITSAGGSPQFLTANQSECYQISDIEANKILSDKITLEAYPNPSVSGGVSLRYSLTGSEHVILRIFDAIGREIATIVDEEKSAGSYEFRFPKNNSIPSGIYYCSLITETANKTVRILIEK